MKTQYLKEKQFPFLIKNREAVFTEEKLQEVSRKTDTVSAENWVKKVGPVFGDWGGEIRHNFTENWAKVAPLCMFLIQFHFTMV